MANDAEIVSPLQGAQQGLHPQAPADQLLLRAGASRPGESSAARPIFLKVFSFPALLAVLLMAGAVVCVYGSLQEVASRTTGYARTSVIEGDTWSHIAVGEDILTTRKFPTIDTYSFTAYGREFMAFEWMGQVGMALVARGGPPALTIALLVLGVGLLLLLYYYAYLRSGNPKAAFVACTLLLPMVVVFFTLRPQLLGYIFLLLTLICLEQFRQGRERWVWVLPGLFLVWVNTHATFLLGLFVVGVYWASGLVAFRWGGLETERWTARQGWQLTLAMLLSVLVLPVTPYGVRLVTFPVHVLLHAPLGMTEITEYLPLGAFGWWLKVFVALLLGFLVVQVVFRRTYRLEEMALLLFTAYSACVHARFLLFFALIFAPLAATLLAPWIPRYQAAKDRPVLNIALMVLVAVGLVAFFPSRSELERVVAHGFPQGAVNYLRQHPAPGRMLNIDLWGAYLTRSLGREHKIFIDGRSQLFEDVGVFGDYLRIMRLDAEAPALLRKYNLQACLIERDDALARLLAVLPGWRKVYEDDLSVLFFHEGEQPGRERSGSDGDTSSGALEPRSGRAMPDAEAPSRVRLARVD